MIGNEYNDYDLMTKVPLDIIHTLKDMNYTFIQYQEQDTFECLQSILTVLQHEIVHCIYLRQKGTLECIMDEDDASEVSGERLSMTELDSELPYQPALSVPSVNPQPSLCISETSNNLSSWDVLYDLKKGANGIYSKRKVSADMNVPTAPKFPFRGMTATVFQCLLCWYKVLHLFNSLFV